MDVDVDLAGPESLDEDLVLSDDEAEPESSDDEAPESPDELLADSRLSVR